MVASSLIRLPMYAKQRDFLLCDKPMKTFRGGRGSGKSLIGALDIITRSRSGGVYVVIAPTYGVLSDATRRSFEEVARKLSLWDEKKAWEQPRPRCILRNGAEFLFRSADDPEKLRGGDKAGAWLDELQDSDEEAFRIIEPSLRQWGQRGFITGTMTPGSPDHWTSKELINSGNPDLAVFAASLKENIFIGPEVYEGLLRSWAASPLRIRRELEGECLYLEGAEWDPQYFEDCWFDEWPSPEEGGVKVLSLDSSLGKDSKPGHGDYAAYVQTLFLNGVFYVDADLRQGQDGSVIAQSGVELYSRWLPHYFVVEEEMGMHMLIREMHRLANERKIVMAITPMDTEKLNKIVRIRARLTPYVSRRMFRFKRNSPGVKLMLEQFQAFPRGQHDDAIDSLEYGIRCIEKAMTGKVTRPTTYGLNAMGAIAA